MVMFAIVSFLPLFVVVVLESSATDAGRVLTPMMLAVVIGSAIGSPVVLRIGYRLMCVASFAFLLVGTAMLTTVGVGSSQLFVSVAMVCIGTGMGFGFIATMLAGQNSVDLPRMGVATGLVNFTRQLGGVFGVAVAAALMLSTLTSRLTELLPGAHIKAAELLSPAAATRFPAETQDLVRGAFADALHVVFVATLVIALVGMLTVALMPGGKPADIRDAAHGVLPEAVLPDGEMILITPDAERAEVEAPPPGALRRARQDRCAAGSPTTPRGVVVHAWSAMRSSVAVAGGSPVPRLRAYTGWAPLDTWMRRRCPTPKRWPDGPERARPRANVPSSPRSMLCGSKRWSASHTLKLRPSGCTSQRRTKKSVWSSVDDTTSSACTGSDQLERRVEGIAREDAARRREPRASSARPTHRSSARCRRATGVASAGSNR